MQMQRVQCRCRAGPGPAVTALWRRSRPPWTLPCRRGGPQSATTRPTTHDAAHDPRPIIICRVQYYHHPASCSHIHGMASDADDVHLYMRASVCDGAHGRASRRPRERSSLLGVRRTHPQGRGRRRGAVLTSARGGGGPAAHQGLGGPLLNAAKQEGASANALACTQRVGGHESLAACWAELAGAAPGPSPACSGGAAALDDDHQIIGTPSPHILR